MKLEISHFQAFAASLAVEGEVCDLPNARLWMQAAEVEIAPLIQRLRTTSTAEIERLIMELQEARDHLQSERERIERETLRYTSLTQMASSTAKIISDAVSQWSPARNEQKSDAAKPNRVQPEDGLASHRRGHGEDRRVVEAGGRGTCDMKVTWQDLGCPDGPGIYVFKDGTIDVGQQELSIWDRTSRRALYREEFPTVDW
jgi:hypothetical protein